MTAPSDWARVKTCLGTVFKEASGLEYRWLNESSVPICPPFGTLNLASIANIGQRHSFWIDVVPDAGPVVECRNVIRETKRFTWQVDIESLDFCEPAWMQLDEASNKLALALAHDKLQRAGLVVESFESIVPLDIERENRWISRARLDIQMRYGKISYGCKVPIIEKLTVQGTILGETGDPLPPSLNTQLEVGP